MHTYVHPSLLLNLWSSPAAPAQKDVLTSGGGLVVTSLYLGYIKQPTTCLPQWSHFEHNYTQGLLWSKLQTPRSKRIKEIHDPALPLPSMGEGLCPYQQGVLVSDFRRILQLVLETLGKPVSEEAKVWHSLAAKRYWEEKGPLTHTKGTHSIKVWTPQHFIILPFQWTFSLKIQMFTGMKDKDFLRIFARCLSTFSSYFLNWA